MPHALFLGSYLATQDRVSTGSTPDTPILPAPAPNPRSKDVSVKKVFHRLFAVSKTTCQDEIDLTTPYGKRDNNALPFIKAHLKHGVWDIVMSLLGFAVVINSA